MDQRFMPNEQDPTLSNFEVEELDRQAAKIQKWSALKQQQAAVARQQALQKEAFSEAAKELGISEEELWKTVGAPASPDEMPLLEDHFKEKTKNYWIERAGMKKGGAQGGRMQDAHGKFTSPRKEAARADAQAAYKAKVQDLTARVRKGERLSEDELLSIMPTLF